MKNKIFCYSVLLVFCSLFAMAQKDLQKIEDFGSNPGNLKMFIHLPDSNSHKTRLPLVIALHGCSQVASTVSTESGWSDLADRYGFYMVYPQQKILNNPSECFKWYDKGDIEKDKGEAFSIKQMIDYMCKTYPVDTTRIFVYGLSAGAVMGVALLADYPYLFNAGAILAGGPYMLANPMDAFSSMSNPKEVSSKDLGEQIRTQNPDYKGSYPRLIIYHGDKDYVVNIKNSYHLIKQWAYLVHTDTVPSKTVQAFAKDSDITQKIYSDTLHREKILFYEVSGLGHTLMVFPGDSAYQGGHTGLFSVNKHFFSTYWIAKDFGLIDSPQTH